MGPISCKIKQQVYREVVISVVKPIPLEGAVYISGARFVFRTIEEMFAQFFVSEIIFCGNRRQIETFANSQILRIKQAHNFICIRCMYKALKRR